MIQRIAILLLFLFGFFASAFVSPAFALKKRVIAPRANYASAKLNRNSHSVVVTFSGSSNIARFSYVLNYNANGTPEGVVGSFVSTGASDSRDLYFGTCSKGVCTPHYGITNATLTITTTLKNGSSYIKRFVLKNV